MARIKLSPIANQDEVFNSPRAGNMNRRILKKQVKVDDDIVTLESAIVQTNSSITTSITQYDTTVVQPTFATKEPVIYKSTAAPAHVEGRMWLDTSTDPNVMKRSIAGVWVRAGFTQSEIESTASSISSSVVSSYAYSKGEINTTLTGYSQISQTSSAITLAVGTVKESTGNFIPYTQDDFEQGTLSLTTGATSSSSNVLRMKTFEPISASMDILLECSGGLIDPANVYIIYYTSADAFISYHAFTGGYRKVTTPATAAKFKVRMQKTPLTSFPISEMPNHKVMVTQIGKYLKGARYNFDDTSFSITNNSNVVVFTADVDGNLDITGKITADSGLVGGFTIGTTKLTAGTTNATAVGVQSGETVAFFAGHLTPGSAPFRVTRAGALTATNATLTGGTIAGWSIGTTAITKGTTSLSASGTNGTLTLNGTTISSSTSGLLDIAGSLTVSTNITCEQLSTYSILPRATNTYSLGTSSFRFLGVYTNALYMVFSSTAYTITRDANGFLKAV
jgi:hypothetical protein